MAMEFLSGLHFLHWQLWVTPLVALVSVGLTLVLGRKLFRAPKSEVAQETTAASPDPFEFGSARERRTAPRRTGKPVKVLVSNETAQTEPEPGVIVNRSLGGLGIMFDREVPEDSILSIRADTEVNDCPWVQVQVRRCTPRKTGQWELGCQFVRPPAWSVLLQLS